MVRSGWNMVSAAMTLTCLVGARGAAAQEAPAAVVDAPEWTVTLDADRAFTLYETREGAAGLTRTVERRDDTWVQLVTTTHAFTGPARLAAPRPTAAAPDAAMALDLRGDALAITVDGRAVEGVDHDGDASPALPAAAISSAGWMRTDALSPTGFVNLIEPGETRRAVTVLVRRDVDGRWRWRAHGWGASHNLPSLDDLDDDGVAEWIATDDASGGATSAEGPLGPLGIWRVDGDAMAPVTWRFPSVVESHRRWLATIFDSEPAAASWVAETQLLGRAVRRSAVRAIAPSGDGEIFRGDYARWMRRVRPLASRYVTTHGAARRR